MKVSGSRAPIWRLAEAQECANAYTKGGAASGGLAAMM